VPHFLLNEWSLAMTTALSSAVKGLHWNLDRAGQWLAPLTLRLFIAWEFFESGLEKFNGQNWFEYIQERFPFPFDHLPATLNWNCRCGPN